MALQRYRPAQLPGAYVVLDLGPADEDGVYHHDDPDDEATATTYVEGAEWPYKGRKEQAKARAAAHGEAARLNAEEG